eukprot:scaffold30235_cov67-Cyclotella_meneghiniana.AAC.2
MPKKNWFTYGGYATRKKTSKRRSQYEEAWNKQFIDFKEFLQKYGTYPPMRGNKLGRWVCKQRLNYRDGILNARRIGILDSIGFEWAGLRKSNIKANNEDDMEAGDDDVPLGIASESAAMPPLDVSGEETQMEGTQIQPSRTLSSSSDQFKVNIPKYYRDILPARIRDKASVENAETSATALEKKDSNDAPSATPSTKEERVQQHQEFIAALEKYGSRSGSEDGTLAWHAMAEELNWPIEDVKVYAYSYFKALTVNVQMKEKSASKNPKIQSSWTPDELLLLDCLMVKHCTTTNGPTQENRHIESKDCYSRDSIMWEKIAAGLPGKTSRDCYEVGISRLV